MLSGDRQISLFHDDRRLHFRKLFEDQAAASFFNLSVGIGVVAFLLPIAVVAAGGYDGHFSISYYYYVNDTSRSFIVGGLWATGVFLFLFRGLSKWENRMLNLAGVLGIAVSLFPMGDDQSCKRSGFDLHATCAIIFFLCLAVVAIGFSKSRLDDISDARVRRNFKRWYNGTGVAMIALPTTVVLIHLAQKSPCATHSIFWIETLGIWAFSAYWFVKTAEYRLLLGARFSPFAGMIRDM